MPRQWFRMYASTINNPKVQSLPGGDFKAWVNVLCLACENDGKLPPLADIAFALRMDEIACASVLDRLAHRSLIERRKGGPIGWYIAPHDWANWQYDSDSSTERVQRFRNARRNVAETPPESESESEESPLTPLVEKPPDSGSALSALDSALALASAPALARALCDISGAPFGPMAVAHCSRWLGDGIPVETCTRVVREMAAHGETRSLKRFDSPIRRAHAPPATAPLAAASQGIIRQTVHALKVNP